MMDNITSSSIDNGGASVYDNSKLYQVEGMYDFTHLIQFMEIQVGLSERVYSVNSNGTVFFDEPGNPIIINQFGSFIQINKNLINDRLRITGAFRFDKNQYFEAQYTPRFSMIFFLTKTRNKA